MIPIKRPTHTAPYVVHYGGHAYTLRKLSCNGGAHFLRHSVEGVLLSVPNVFQTELCLHLSCCMIPSCWDKGRAWASSLARSLWFHCSLSRAFGDKRASSIASQPWFCVLLLSARCFTYQLFVILSSSFFHFSNSVMSLNVMLSIFKSWPWWLLRWCIKSPVVAKADLERQGK